MGRTLREERGKAGPRRDSARHRLSRTHDRPMRYVVLPEHSGQLSVGQDRIVVHGRHVLHREAVLNVRGGPGLWTRNGQLRAWQRKRQRLRSCCGRVTPLSRLRHSRGYAGCARSSGQAQTCLNGRYRPVWQWEQAGLANGNVTLVWYWLEQEEGGASRRAGGAGKESISESPAGEGRS